MDVQIDRQKKQIESLTTDDKILSQTAEKGKKNNIEWQSKVLLNPKIQIS